MGDTTIAWTNKTWNPTRGCSRVSQGCVNCYAERVAARFEWQNVAGEGGEIQKPGPFHQFVTKVNGHAAWTGKVELIESKLLEPLSWRKPALVFVNSMSDLFHEALPDEAIDRVFAVMALCQHLTFQILTKRPERMLKWFRGDDGHAEAMTRLAHEMVPDCSACWTCDEWPLPNVQLGVSVENQETADARIPLLLQTPAAVRFVSYEPALGPVDFTRIDYRQQLRDVLVKFARWSAKEDGDDDEAAAMEAAAAIPEYLADPSDTPVLNVLTGEWFDGWDSGGDGKKLDQIIVGGESGPGARPFQAEWAQSTAEQCRASGTAFFMKQFGANAWQGGDNGTLRTKMPFRDKKGGDISEFPRWAQVREFPGVSA